MVSKNVKIVSSLVVVIILIVAGVSVFELYHPKKNEIIFTDTSQTSPPDHLDPASGDSVVDGPIFMAIYQGLVEYDGSNNTVVPVLASSYSNVSEQNYTFELRNYVTFSNGAPLNASDVWFSLYRGIVMGQGPFTSAYPGILFNATNYGATGIALPWGLRSALTNAGYTLSGNLSDQYTQAANILDYMLSHWNYNVTNLKVMDYLHQAVVVNSEYNVSVNALTIFPYMLKALAEPFWDAVINPTQVDSHGGVVYNTENSYLNLHGAIGTGPYEIKSVGASLSDVVIVSTPNYWATGHSSVPAVAQPAHIPEIVIDYGLSHTDRLEDFDKNTSMISEVGPSSFKSMIDGFYNSSEANGGLIHSYKVEGVNFLSMNTQVGVSKNVYFRKALIDANNYTEQLELYANNYNGSAMAYNELGPMSPSYGKSYYNPSNLPLQNLNLTRAIQNLSKAGVQENFYVTLPNGSSIGNYSNPRAVDLSSDTFTITALAPPTSIESAQVSVFITSFSLLGLHFKGTYVTASSLGSWTSANNTPQFVDLGWYPDYPDPVGQQILPVYDSIDGGVFGGNDAWVDNKTLQDIFANITSENNTEVISHMNTLYNTTNNISAYIWLPVPDTYFFVQPYVHGFQYNQYVQYFYNMMSISFGNNINTNVYHPNYNSMELVSTSSLFSLIGSLRYFV